MKWIQTRTAVPVALMLVVAVFCTRDAAAQTAPTLTATANGAVANVQWTSVPGATAYDVIVTGAFTGVVSVPASTTAFQVTPPPGTYNIQVRGTAGSIVGPPSNLATITVGGSGSPSSPCAPPTAPTLNVSVNGMVVTASWNAVPGAIGYRAEISRAPGGVELVSTVGPGQTSLQGVAPFTGTFYARVVTGNACGTASSPEVSFTVGNATPTTPGGGSGGGGGNRTPDPPPGQLLPMPSYADAVIQDIGRRYPGDLAAHSGPACKAQNSWLFKLLRALRERDTRWGLNWKRGWPGTVSTDIITYNPTSDPDETATEIYLADVLSGECESNIPVFNWERVTQETWRANAENPGACANRYCAAWTILPYLAAGYPAIP